ncbi:hypothetical protein RHGRI_032617 [Rhododendron griersonianum]|uniref:Uncharacterized protein n=1 Tax=Rhododendron griersonianum TaxID=479676 RepID=A0AAV6ICF6_9ERIC|nr:hypothetical protein RHGRI_032617 [Rhododendron griersonianum]
MILYLEDYLLQQNSIAGDAVWCIGFQKIDGQEINDFRRYMFVCEVKTVTQFNSNMDNILGLVSLVWKVLSVLNSPKLFGSAGKRA